MLKLVPYKLLIKIALLVLEYLVTRTENTLDDKLVDAVRRGLDPEAAEDEDIDLPF